MKAIVKGKTEPFDGPYEKNIIKYTLSLGDGTIINWYEKLSDKRTNLNAETGHIIEGLEIELRDGLPIPHYKNSNPRVINRQFLMFDK